MVRARLVAEGVTLHEQASVRGGRSPARPWWSWPAPADSACAARICWSPPAASANVEGLGLEAAGIAHDQQGNQGRRPAAHHQRAGVRDRRRGGRARSSPMLAGYQAGIVIRNALFRLPGTGQHPRDPLGDLHRSRARHSRAERGRAHGRRASRTRSSAGRSPTTIAPGPSGQTKGWSRSWSAGAAGCWAPRIVGAHAGELILPWVLAVEQRLKLRAMAGLVVPYPTLGEVSKRVAGAYYAPRLFGPRVRWLVRLLAELG